MLAFSIIFVILFRTTCSLFFPTLGFGSSNCQCQTSCNMPAPPMGCFCAQPPNGCGQTYPQQPAIPSFPSYQPQFAPNNYPVFPSFSQGLQPPAPAPLPLPPPPPPPNPQPYFQQQTQFQVQPYGASLQQTYVQPSPLVQNPNAALRQVKLQPPTRLETEYMNQLVKVLETSTQSSSLNELPKSYFETNPGNQESNRIADENLDSLSADIVKEVQPSPTSSNNYSPPRYPLKGQNEIKTTEIKISQIPYEEEEVEDNENYSNRQHSNENKVEAVWTPSTSSFYTSTQLSRVEPSRYPIEPRRGQGTVGQTQTTTDINESGYEFTGPSSSLAPITLEYLSEAKRTEDSNEISPRDEIDAFTKEVDNFHRNTDVTISLPDETETSTSSVDFGYGNARDPRHSENEDISKKNKTKNASDNEIYDDTTSEEDKSKEEDIKRETVQDISKVPEEKVSKCNSAKLKEAMHMKMSASPSISKQMIYSAAAELYPGRNINVICSKHSFSYIVVTSPVFCEHRKRPLTCFAFFQP